MITSHESALHEWPGFAGMPEQDALPLERPTGQTLARYVWWDGQVREGDTLSVHYYANALHYGTAVFEGIRVYPQAGGGEALFRPADHMERLLHSGRLYGMTIPYGVEDLVAGASELVRRNEIKYGYLRPLAYYAQGPIDLKPKRECPVRCFIAARELGTFLGENALRNGIRLTVSSWRKFHHTMLPTMAKASGHYANSVLAAHEALDRGFDDAVMLNDDGTVASATGENIFFVRGGRVFTNDEASSIVPGITRDTLIELARELDIPVTIKAFTREELIRADEVFLTGTAAEVTPVRELDGIGFATGPRSYAAAFQQAYLRAVTGKDGNTRGWLHRT